MYLQAIKGLGGNPVVIPPTEVYAALERNVVDGYCWPAVGIRDWGWQKHTQYVVDPGFYNVPNPLLINLKMWNQTASKAERPAYRSSHGSREKGSGYYLMTLQNRNAPYSSRKASRLLTCLQQKKKNS